jgi:hypothetical protein
MKKVIFTTLLLIAVPATLLAQLKVNSSGKASIALSSPVTAADLSTFRYLLLLVS